MIIWLVSLFAFAIFILFAWVQYERKGMSHNEVFVPLLMIIAPIFLFVMAYYGIKRKVSFSESFMLIIYIIALIIFLQQGLIITLILAGMYYIIHFIIFNYGTKLKMKLISKDKRVFTKNELYAQKIGIMFLIIGLFLLSFFLIFGISGYLKWGHF